MTELDIAYEKAEAIIKSCETCDQIDNAQSYIDLFDEKFNDTIQTAILKGLLDVKKIELNCHSVH